MDWSSTESCARDVAEQRPFDEFIEEFKRDPDNVSWKEMQNWSSEWQFVTDERKTTVWIYFDTQDQLNTDLTTTTIPCLVMMHIESGGCIHHYVEYAVIDDGPIVFNLSVQELDDYREAIELMKNTDQLPQSAWYLNNVTYRKCTGPYTFDEFISTFISAPRTIMIGTINYYQIFNQHLGDDHLEIKFRYQIVPDKHYKSGPQLILTIKRKDIVHKTKICHVEVIELTPDLDQIKFDIPILHRDTYEMGLKMLRENTQSSQIRWFLDLIEPRVKGCK